MLNIEYGSYQKLYDKYGEDFIYDPDMYFNNTYDEKWITSDIARKIIKDIDKSEVLGENCIESPILGQISPKDLSGGAKTLMLIYNNPNLVINASACGDNCVKWLLQMAEEKDIFIKDIEERLMNTLGTKVNISTGNKKGKIEIEYYTDDDLNDIIDRLLEE